MSERVGGNVIAELISMDGQSDKQIPDWFKFTYEGVDYFDTRVYNILRLLLFDIPYDSEYADTSGTYTVSMTGVRLRQVIHMYVNSYDKTKGIWRSEAFPNLPVSDVRYKAHGITRDLDFKVPTWMGNVTDLPVSLFNILNGKGYSDVTFNYQVIAEVYSDSSDMSETQVLFNSGVFTISKVSIDMNTFDDIDTSDIVPPIVEIEGVPLIYKYNSLFMYCATTKKIDYISTSLMPLSHLFDINKYIIEQSGEAYPGISFDFVNGYPRNSYGVEYTKDNILSAEFPIASSKETLLTYLSKFLLFFGGALIPDYSLFVGSAHSQNYSPQIKFKVPQFYLTYGAPIGASTLPCQFMGLENWYSDSIDNYSDAPTRYFMSLLYDFGLVDADSAPVARFSTVEYQVTYYSDYRVRSTDGSSSADASWQDIALVTSDYSTNVTGLIEVNAQIPTGAFARYKNSSPDDIIIKGLVVQGSDGRFGQILYYQANKDSVRYVYPQSDVHYISYSGGSFHTPQNPVDYTSGNYGFGLIVQYYKTESYTMVYSSENKDTLSRYSVSFPFFAGRSIDVSGVPVGSGWLSNCKFLRSYVDYTTGEATFTTFWRPWINIYDVVRFKCRSEDGSYKSYFGFVIDMDVQADTHTATYKVLISNYPAHDEYPPKKVKFD